MKPTVLGLIPARGGSKSIPEKNIAMLSGAPLISYVIKALQKASSVSRIVVSTNDQKIAEVSRSLGADVPFLRPESFSTDTSKVLEALQFTLQKLKQEEGYIPDYIVTVQPTSPLIRSADIDAAVELALEKKAESVVSVEPLPHRYHPHNIRQVTSEGFTRFWMEKEHYEVLNRQQRPKFFAFGNLYVSSFELLAERGRLEGERNYQIEINPLTAIDIDGPNDLALVEALIKLGVCSTN